MKGWLSTGNVFRSDNSKQQKLAPLTWSYYELIVLFLFSKHADTNPKAIKGRSKRPCTVNNVFLPNL